LPDNARQQLQAQFAALLLAGCSDVIETFPQDTPLFKQYALIRNALQAYFQGDSVELSLKKIPFRSPYRDFRPILKALLLIEVDPNAANQLLEKVPADSVYAQFAALVRIVGQDGETLLTTLSKLSAQEQLFIAGLKGWDKEQLNVISKLQTAAKRDGSPKALLEVVAASRNILGDNRQFCLALLPSYPAGVKFYEKKFGSLSAFEKNRITALKYERQEQSEMADRYWRLCVENLKQSSDNRLKAALILRHLVELAERSGEIFDDYQVPEDLAESLRLDPDDKASYLKLIQWYNHENDIKNYHKWVDAAIKQFPQDSEVLLTGIESATRKKAFKKAANFAKALLKVDPINIKARQIARFSHISHARKLIRSGKYELARKELEQGARFEKNQQSGIVQINQGLLELQAEGFIQPLTRKRSTRRKSKASDLFELQQPKNFKSKHPKPIELLQEGFNLAGGSLCGFFRIIVETKSQQLEPANILPLLPKLDKRYLPTQHEVLELLSLINAYSGVTFLTEALTPLITLLQKAAKLDFSQEEILSICECFKKLEHYALVRQFAENALKRWPEQPVFVYYQIYSQSHSKKRFWHISNSDVDRLTHAADKATEQGDQRTAMLIVKFLNEMKPPSFFNPFVMDDFEDDFESDIEALKNMDFEDLTPQEMIKLINRLKKLGIEIPDF